MKLFLLLLLAISLNSCLFEVDANYNRGKEQNPEGEESQDALSK